MSVIYWAGNHKNNDNCHWEKAGLGHWGARSIDQAPHINTVTSMNIEGSYTILYVAHGQYSSLT